MKIEEINGKISNIVDLTSSVRHFVIDLEEDLDFEAGQFVRLGINFDGQVYSKPYSIASIPENKRQIELCIKLIGGGMFTPKLFEKKIGESVVINGPYGKFVISDECNDKVFIGCGTGIAPLRSLIKSEILKNTGKKLSLLYGVRKENEILYQEEFEDLEKKNSSFRFVKVVSRPKDNWTGRIKHVQDNLDFIENLNSNFYLCGLFPMIEETREKLIKLSVDESKIHYKRFA